MDGKLRLRLLRDGTRKLGHGSRFLQRSDAQVSRERDVRLDWRRWYKTAAWQRLRWQVLVRDAFTCARCGYEAAPAAEARVLLAAGRADLVKGRAPEMVADHVVPHRGNEALFWAETNLQCLCRTCHDSAKQRQERGGRR
ncbi:MAG: HNH endonuclease [Gemmobacter sp.]